MVIKCKMCGGDLGEAVNGIATCKYCGTTQTLPKFTGERKASLYDRADHYRAQGEFDRAFSLYEQILLEDDTDAEVYWDMVLCHYGIEYVEDPGTHKRIPTVNRVQYQSIFEDRNYLSAIEHATAEQKEVLQSEASRINQIQNDILEISNKEKPYDIFICYKETDDRGNRTLDSVLAQDLYNELVKEGYKVFFSRITLEDKIGTAYEPYIFAALNSAKIMIAVGTSAKNNNAVWVKNEWSRYLSLIKNGEKKTLIPAYRDMDPYDLPEEFAHLQAQDMGKLGFMQDLVRGINKIIKPKGKVETVSVAHTDFELYKSRAAAFLSSKDYDKAISFCDKALDLMPEDAEVYCIKLCAQLRVKEIAEIGQRAVNLERYVSYQNAVKYGDNQLKEELEKQEKAALINLKKEQQKQKKAMKYLAVAAVVLIVIAGVRSVVSSAIQKRQAEIAAAEEEQARQEAAEAKKQKELEEAEAAQKAADEKRQADLEKAEQSFSLGTVAGYREALSIMSEYSLSDECKQMKQEIYEIAKKDFEEGNFFVAKDLFELLNKESCSDSEAYIEKCDEAILPTLSRINGMWMKTGSNVRKVRFTSGKKGKIVFSVFNERNWLEKTGNAYYDYESGTYIFSVGAEKCSCIVSGNTLSCTVYDRHTDEIISDSDFAGNYTKIDD